jgi:hypothetical protein
MYLLELRTPILFSVHSVNQTELVSSNANLNGLEVLPQISPLVGIWYSTRVWFVKSNEPIALPSCSLNHTLSPVTSFQYHTLSPVTSFQYGNVAVEFLLVESDVEYLVTVDFDGSNIKNRFVA